MDDLFADLILQDARGGRREARAITIEVERALEAKDLPLLAEAPAVAPAQGILLGIRHAHHQLARHLVLGEELAEISLLTGYSIAYISSIQNDPTFKELLRYYESQKEMKFVDTMERMKTLGLSVLDELQRRLEEDPEGWKKSELMNMADLLLLRSKGAPGSSNTSAQAGVSVSVTFVSPEPVAPVLRTIEHLNGEAQ